MGKSIAAGLLVLLSASSAWAQEGLPAAPLAAPAAPSANVAPVPGPLPPPSTVALPATPPEALSPAHVPPAFFARFLSYDADEKQVLMGQRREPLTREQVFAELGRPDLLEKSRTAERRRLIFGVSGGVVLAAGLITAAVAQAGMPNLNAGYCLTSIETYNEICVPDAKRREAISATGLIAGVSLGGILGALAMANSPNILSKDEVEGLIANHNTTLMRRLRDGAIRPKLTPTVAWKGGGVALSFQF